MTVQELIDQLSKVEDKTREAVVWLPGSTISLQAVMGFTIRLPVGEPVKIEGNFVDGSDVTMSR